MIKSESTSSLSGDNGWKGELELEFSPAGSKTIISGRRHFGPLAIQRPFYPEGEEVCHVYALHPPGGIVGGDSLHYDVTVKSGAHALITTPSAGKFYRTVATAASQIQELSVESGGALDWLPLETIVYPGSEARLATRVNLEGDAAFFGWEIICLGLPASGSLFTEGKFIQTMEIFRDSEPVFMERGTYSGGSAMLDQQWGLSGNTVFGTLVGTFEDKDELDKLRTYFKNEARSGEVALTAMDGLTICRAIGHSAFRVRDLLTEAWNVMRHKQSGRAGCPPRIWNT
jgi:urease accessory protein